MVPAILHTDVRFALRKTPLLSLTIRALTISTIIVSSTQASTPSLDSLFQKEANNVPAQLTRAIAQVESGLHPWALNIAGKGYIFPNKAQAIERAYEAQASGQSFDSGVMQINNRWLSRWHIPLEEAFDPATNIHLGSHILKQEIDRHGLTWDAIGAYHSPNDARQQNYIAKVKAALDPSITIALLRMESRQGGTIAGLFVRRGDRPLLDRPQPAGPLFVQRFGDRQNSPAPAQLEPGFIQRFKKS
jgi:soluble lytic murein transglycosylase-like protein